jgi:hypothetical protein
MVTVGHTITAEETRERIRAGAAAVRKREAMRPPWHPPEVADFAPDTWMLAFDASLVNTGWVAFLVRDGRVIVEGHGTIRPSDRGERGYLATWERALGLQKGLWEAGLVTRFARDPDVLLAVEAPPVGAGHRKESSLIAGMTVWMLGPRKCAVVSPTHVSAVLLGDPRIKSAERKPAVKAAVCRYVPEAAGRSYNEHERDALSVGLTRLFDLKEAA